MFRSAFPLSTAALALYLCAGCSIAPPGATTQVAEIIPQRVLRLVPDLSNGAVFTPALQPHPGEQVRISARLQALKRTQIRIRLFDAADNEVGLAQSSLDLNEGNCNFPGGSRAHATLTATSSAEVAHAVFDVPTNSPGGGRVFVIDDVSVSAAP